MKKKKSRCTWRQPFSKQRVFVGRILILPWSPAVGSHTGFAHKSLGAGLDPEWEKEMKEISAELSRAANASCCVLSIPWVGCLCQRLQGSADCGDGEEGSYSWVLSMLQKRGGSYSKTFGWLQTTMGNKEVL
jgi:hypothetical protein